MHISSVFVATVAGGTLLIAGCAASLSPTTPNASEQDIGVKISQNLLVIHDQYCSGTPEANARLAIVKSKGAPLRVVNEETGKASRIWFIAEPSTTQSGGAFTNRWGVYVHEPEGSSACGVGYVRPDQLDVLKGGRPL